MRCNSIQHATPGNMQQHATTPATIATTPCHNIAAPCNTMRHATTCNMRQEQQHAAPFAATLQQHATTCNNTQHVNYQHATASMQQQPTFNSNSNSNVQQHATACNMRQHQHCSNMQRHCSNMPQHATSYKATLQQVATTGNTMQQLTTCTAPLMSYHTISADPFIAFPPTPLPHLAQGPITTFGRLRRWVERRWAKSMSTDRFVPPAP